MFDFIDNLTPMLLWVEIMIIIWIVIVICLYISMMYNYHMHMKYNYLAKVFERKSHREYIQTYESVFTKKNSGLYKCVKWHICKDGRIYFQLIGGKKAHGVPSRSGSLDCDFEEFKALVDNCEIYKKGELV